MRRSTSIFINTEAREEMIACLRRAHRKRKPKGIGRKERKTKIPNRVPIEARPKSVESRRTYGHWEGDSLVSRKSLAALNSLTERKSRLLLLTRLLRKGSEETKLAVIRRLYELPRHPGHFQSIKRFNPFKKKD
jgi:IS30 family transposase